jgi:predicted nucleotidyltransferase component of viral defense system
VKKKTEALAKKIAGETFLEHFKLVGGTALSVYLKHRLSEDLDFATTEKKLPEKAISDFLNRLRQDGSKVEDILSLAERHDAINEGIDIDAYHQDWSIDGVKLTFFTLSKENGRAKLAEDPGKEWSKSLRLASLETLFITKALVLADRHTMRDNFDMYVLLQRDDFSYADVIKAFKTYRPHTDLNIPINSLLSADYPLTDPGLSGLIDEEEEDTMRKVQEYFINILDLKHS